MWSIVTSKVFIQQNFVAELFEFYLHIHFSLQDIILMVICCFVLLLWFSEFVNFFDMHKMDWIIQKWPRIPIYMSKFYTIKCCQAFLDDTLSFKSHCLYGYSYFCGLEHSKSHCFSCQLTKINFGVPIQIMCYLFY